LAARADASRRGATACRADRGLISAQAATVSHRVARPSWWQDARDVSQHKFADPSTQFAVVAIGRVHQRHARWHTIRQCLAHLLQGDLRFGLEADAVGHSGDRAAVWIIGPDPLPSQGNSWCLSTFVDTGVS
jgi:hypothetical protein